MRAGRTRAFPSRFSCIQIISLTRTPTYTTLYSITWLVADAYETEPWDEGESYAAQVTDSDRCVPGGQPPQRLEVDRTPHRPRQGAVVHEQPEARPLCQAAPGKAGGGGRPRRGGSLPESPGRDWDGVPGATGRSTADAAVRADDRGGVVRGAASRHKRSKAAITRFFREKRATTDFYIADSNGGPTAQGGNYVLGAAKTLLDAGTGDTGGPQPISGRGSDPRRGAGGEVAASSVPAGAAGLMGPPASRP